MAKYPFCDLDLMGQLLDRVRVERDEAIEPRREGDALSLAANLRPEKGAWWFLHPARELGERSLVDGPEIVFGCCGSGHQ